MDTPRREKRPLLDKETLEALDERKRAYDEEQLRLEQGGSDNSTEQLLRLYPGLQNRQII